MKEILIPLNFTTTPVLYDSKQSFSASDEESGVLTFTTTADVTGTVASLTIRNASENANRQTVIVERLDVNSSPFSYVLKNPLPFGQYEGTVLLKKNVTVIASAVFLFGVNSSLSAEVLPDLVKAYSLDELVENVETEVSNLKDAFNLTVSETVKGVNKTESSLQAQENVRYLNEHQRKANELQRIANENARIVEELERKDTFDALVDSAIIEHTVVQEVADKYQEIESTYANRLLSTEQQLADIELNKANIADLPSSAYVFKGSTTFALLPTSGNVVGDMYYTTDNKVNYAWTGTVWTPIGNGAFADGSVVTQKVADKAITPDKTSFFEHPDIFTLVGSVTGVLSTIGSVNPSENAKVSGFIPIDLIKDYKLPFFSFGYAFYNINQVSVDSTRYGYMVDKPTITDMPAGTKYIRVCWYTNQALNPQYYTPDSAVQILDLSSNVLNMPDSIPFEALNFEIPPDRNIYFKWQSSYGLLSIYMKANEKDAYLEYNYQHLTGTQDVGDPTTWYDVWRMRSVYVNTLGTDGTFIRSHPNTIVHTGSEWECAIKESGQVDFIGGSTHGDEYVENIVFMLDGVSYTNPADFAALTCKELRIFRKGSLYRCNTMKGIKVANHYVDYLFKDNTLNINQKVKWTVSTTTDISYLTMLGIKRLDDTGVQITSKALKEGEAVIYDVSVDGFTNGAYTGLNDCKKAYLWNDIGVGLKTNVEVEVLDSNDFPLNNFKVDNRVDYNKMYFDHCGGGFAVASGDIWYNKARYKIDYLGKY